MEHNHGWPSGHCVAWDEGRQVLWTLSRSYLRTYTLAKRDTQHPEVVTQRSIRCLSEAVTLCRLCPERICSH